MKTAEEYKTSLMWCGGNTLYEKIDWTLKKRDQEFSSLIDEMINKWAGSAIVCSILIELKNKLGV